MLMTPLVPSIMALAWLSSGRTLGQEPSGLAVETKTLAVKHESFDRDPGWEGVNNRSARDQEPRPVRQDFGFSRATRHAGGVKPGEIGGWISAAAEPAFYGKVIERADLTKPLTASGKMLLKPGGTHLLLGFFNANAVNEWRTPNTIAIRLNGRGDLFFAYVEYCTARWRAGGDTTPFPAITDAQTGRWNLVGYPCNQPLDWTLEYDPSGNGGRGSVVATIGRDTAVCNLDESHKRDGAGFDRFGILNVTKSVDSGSEAWFDDIAIGGDVEPFDRDPLWDGRNNRSNYTTRNVRPWFDFGHSDTQHAGGKAKGELGGQVFRGDCRYPDKMACYGDRIGPLSFDRPITASGKIALARGVSDSTTLFGFYHSQDSMRSNDSQRDGLPESVLGVQVEGPSSEGFKFYPVVRAKGGSGISGDARRSPTILPNGNSHDWRLEYDPDGAGGKGQVIVTLDGESVVLDLPAGTKAAGTRFNRFGIVTTWIDGNGQNIYLDDITYTAAQE